MMVGIFPRERIEGKGETSIFEDLGQRKKPSFGERIRTKARAGFRKAGERIKKRIAEESEERSTLRKIERESRFEERKRLAKRKGKLSAQPLRGLDFFEPTPRPRFTKRRRRDDDFSRFF